MVSPCCNSSRHIAHSPASLLSTSSLYVILGFVKHITRCKSISSEGTNFEHTGHLNPPNKCGERWAGSEPITRRGPPGPPPAGRSRSLEPTPSSGLLCTESCEPYGPPLPPPLLGMLKADCAARPLAALPTAPPSERLRGAAGAEAAAAGPGGQVRARVGAGAAVGGGAALLGAHVRAAPGRERANERARQDTARGWCSGSRTDAVAAGPPRRAATACYRAPRPPHRLLPGGRCHRRHPPAPRRLGKWEAPGRIGGRLPARQPLATGKRNGRRVPRQPSPRGRHWRSGGRVEAKRRDWVPLS